MHNPEVGDIYIALVSERFWVKGKLYKVHSVSDDIFSLKPLIGTFSDNRKWHSLYVRSLNPHHAHSGQPLVEFWNG